MSEKTNSVQFVTIDASHEGQRVDNFLITYLKGVPKSLVYRIIRKGEVRVNKKRVKAVYRLQSEDVVRIPPVRVAEKTEDIPVSEGLAKVLRDSVLQETDNWLVMNKPHGLSVHAGSGIKQGLIEALRQVRKNDTFLELVHRLDKDTSGCILIAKNRKSLNFLQQALKDKAFSKKYHALVAGRWSDKVVQVNQPLLKSGDQSERMVRVNASQGKEAITRFKVLERFSRCTLVEAEPVTGRTHQIRVHAQFTGHPLIGDVKYGNKQADSAFQQKGFFRMFLHAASLGFPDPDTGSVIRVNAPHDKAMKDLLKQLHKEAG